MGVSTIVTSSRSEQGIMVVTCVNEFMRHSFEVSDKLLGIVVKRL